MDTPKKQVELAQRFQRLHVKGDPVVLFNAWDAGSAKIVAASGARAIATGSWSVAAAQGYEDGQELPLEAALNNLARIVASVSLPVTIDLEAGYGEPPEIVAETVSRAIAAGAIGCNLEDQVIGGEGLYAPAEQTRRLRAARDAAERAGVPIYINARTDVFLKARGECHDASLVDAALERARAYADAGASGLFAPGLADEELMARLCAESPLPVNIMVMANTPSAGRMAELGVSRISHGPGPYRLAMRALQEAAKVAYAPR